MDTTRGNDDVGGLGALAVVLGSLCIPFLALTKFGLWSATEPVEIGLFAIGALAAAVVSWTALNVASPIVYVLQAIVTVSVPLLLLQPHPLRSFLGTPEIGEGIAWYATLLVLTILGAATWRRYPMTLCWVIALGVGAISAASPYLMETWPNWLAFIGYTIALIPSPVAVVAVVPLAASLSKGAWALAILVPLLYGALITLGRVSSVSARAMAAALAVTIPIAVTFATFELSWPSAHSRVMLMSVVWDSIVLDPWSILWGHGWGGFNDALMTVWDSVARRDPKWEGLGYGAFHGHNMALEFFMAMGLPGVVLWIAFAVSVPLMVPARRLPWVGAVWVCYMGLSAMWFSLPHCVPFLALALGSNITGPIRQRIVNGPAYSFLCVGLFSCAVLAWQNAAQGDRILATIQQPYSGQVITYDDHGRGGIHLWYVEMLLEVDAIRNRDAMPLDEAQWLGVLRPVVANEIAQGRAGQRLQSIPRFFWPKKE